MSQDEKTFKGQCFCGAVTIEVTGNPVAAGYCHCRACRSWSAGPVNAFTLWMPESVKVTQGEDQIGDRATLEVRSAGRPLTKAQESREVRRVEKARRELCAIVAEVAR